MTYINRSITTDRADALGAGCQTAGCVLRRHHPRPHKKWCTYCSGSGVWHAGWWAFCVHCLGTGKVPLRDKGNNDD